MTDHLCSECGLRPISARGLCNPCYKRAARANGTAMWAERDRQASRNWKRAHPQQARDLGYDDCECGGKKHRRHSLCRTCWKAKETARLEERYRQIEAWWAEGLLIREIAERLGWSSGHVRMELGRMRACGRDLPLRNPRRVAA